MEDHLADAAPVVQADDMVAGVVLQLQGERGAVPARVCPGCKGVVQPDPGARAVELELGTDVGGEVEDLDGVGQDELAGEQVVVFLGDVNLSILHPCIPFLISSVLPFLSCLLFLIIPTARSHCL